MITITFDSIDIITILSIFFIVIFLIYYYAYQKGFLEQKKNSLQRLDAFKKENDERHRDVLSVLSEHNLIDFMQKDTKLRKKDLR